MFSKSFISLYFLAGRVLLLRLSPNKKKVKKYAEVEIPGDSIKDGQIKDLGALSKVLSSSWSKLHIKEKVVGIVIPESSTYTKYFKLPGLSASEIDEAVRWQAQEYLPNGLDNTILDWKITSKDKSGVEVMTVSVDKDVLSEYIAVVEKAGLFPMKVETPSECLLRYSSKEDGGVLTIYRNIGETILVLSEGEKIAGTSIQQTDNFREILSDASKMLKYYKDINVEKILVGGAGVEENLENIASSLGKKVQVIDPKIGGLERDAVQKNLIPISMQFEDAEQPSDPTTLNLLPTYLVDKYKSQKIKNQVWSLTLTITLFVWVSFFMTLATYLFMTQNISNLKAEVNNSQLPASKNPLQEIESINAVSSSVLKIKNATAFPQTILNDIYISKPTGVSIGDYDLDLDKGEIGLMGVAADRLTLIQFKENLESVATFEKVEIPISSFEAETNLEFNLTFSYVPISSTVKEKPVKVNPAL